MALLNLVLFLPLATGLVLLTVPARSWRGIRWTALTGSAVTLVLVAVAWIGFEPGGGLQWRVDVPWIPAIGARYDIAVDGLSLPLVALTAVVFLTVHLYVLGKSERTKAHAFLFLLMQTGLTGVFLAQDLLLFYLFFEIALVPMYFVVGVWGHEDRRYAAIKFFLYTRAGSLAMLLSFLALWLWMDPHTFSLPEIAAAQPLAGNAAVGGWVLLGMVLGFGVKLPTFPVHNWLPDAHVEAPTEGSVVLAALQLKMGAYGLVRVAVDTVPGAVRDWAWTLLALGLVSMVYAALAALAQRDLKRLVAYTSINHMGYVMAGVAVWGLTMRPDVAGLALTGATYQIVSHGLLTGGMFFAVGLLQDQAHTRDLPVFGDLMRRMPVYAVLLAVLAFGSLGLPGLSGFVAEFQVVGAVVSESLWAAAVVILGLVITTALYLRVVSRLLLGEAPDRMPALVEPPARGLTVLAALAVLSVLLGVLPALLVDLIAPVALVLGGGS